MYIWIFTWINDTHLSQVIARESALTCYIHILPCSLSVFVGTIYPYKLLNYILPFVSVIGAHISRLRDFCISVIVVGTFVKLLKIFLIDWRWGDCE